MSCKLFDLSQRESNCDLILSKKHVSLIQHDQQCLYVHVYYSTFIYVAIDICKDFITEFTAKSKASCIDRSLLSIVLHVFGGHN